MMTSRKAVLGICALALGVLPLASNMARGSLVLVDDFETYNTGDLATESGGIWSTTAGTQTVALDPAGGANKVASIQNTAGGQADLSRSIPTIAVGTTGPMFLRVRTTEFETGFADWVFGSSDVITPSGSWNHFEGYARLSDTDGVINMDARDGGGFTTAGPASADTWYNVWLVLEQGPDTATPGTETLYFNTGLNDATAPGTVTASGTFRTSGNSTHDDLITAYFRNNQIGTTGYIDDIYVDTSGITLTNPVPEPGTLMLAAGGLLGLALFRNRRAS